MEQTQEEKGELLREDALKIFDGVKYQDLKKAFDKEGIPSGVFRAGVKKEDLLNEAADYLVNLRKEIVEESLASNSEKPKENEKPENSKEVSFDDKYKNISLEDLEKNLHILKVSSKQATKSQRLIKARKRIEIEKAIAERKS